MFGKKAFPWWRLGGVGGSNALHTKAGGACAAAALGLLAVAGELQASPAAAGPDASGWCASGAAPLSLTALAAYPAPRKFALAEAACGSLGAPRAQTAAPRLAAQLSLYTEPSAAEQSFDDVVAPAAPAVGPAPRSPRRAPAASGATVQRIRALVPVVADAAVRYGIDPLLLHAVAHVESRHQAGARSHAGARGVMQVMPGTARRFGLDDPLRELLQPELNVAVGAEYLKTLQKRFGNDLSLVLAAYNAGEGAVEKYGRRIPPYPETQAYVRDVLATYAELRRRLGAPTGVAGSV